MTATVSEKAAAKKAKGTGRVSRVIGPVCDIEFAADEMPEIYNALRVDIVLCLAAWALVLAVVALCVAVF